MATPAKTSKRRWALLRNAILKASAVESSSAMSIFQFHDPLLPQPTVFNGEIPQADYDWIEYAVPGGHSILLHQRKEKAHVSLRELAVREVDNTGNIRTWPSEDIILRYLLKTLPTLVKSAPLRVLELGAGMCGVAGFAIAAACSPSIVSQVTITDGNEMCIQNLQRIHEINVKHQHLINPVQVELLQWSRDLSAPIGSKYDVIFASDCLFFEKYHDDLLHTIATNLTESGTCMMLQPSRGGSLERFCIKAKSIFSVQLFPSQYDDLVDTQVRTSDPRFDPDIHHPQLLILKRL